jgi:phosphopantothenoylcysteine decarboxylase / phosphopantothenate---cysteine ligase
MDAIKKTSVSAVVLLLLLSFWSGYNVFMKVTVGVSGGIAAYKAAELVRTLQRQALDVHVVMTESARKFIQPLTFSALTGHRVITGLWSAESSDSAGLPDAADGASSSIEHIASAQTTDVLVVAPATANILAKFAHGTADDFLSTMYLATTAPVVVAPAMNINMWQHAATQANIQALESRGVRVVSPASGYLACGMEGQGRLADNDDILRAVLDALNQSNDLAGEVVLVTAGGTREALDPVRFIGNRSSGKMGYAIAEAAQRRGARVVLVTAPTSLRPPSNCEVVPVITADEMRAAVLSRLDAASIVIKAAAVADYRPRMRAEQKMKRSGPLVLEFEPTEDILAEVVRKRKPGTLVIGFAAETQDPLQHGRAKLTRKGADAIVLNDVSRAGLGFDSDNNAATFLTEQTAIEFPEMTKRELADRILDETVSLRRPQMVLDEGLSMMATGAARAKSPFAPRD